MSGYITKLNLGLLKSETIDGRSAYERIITNDKQSAIDSFDYLLKKYTNISASYVLEFSLEQGDFGPDSLGYYRFSDYPESGFNPSSLGFRDNPVMCNVRCRSSYLLDVGDEIYFAITFYFSNSGNDFVTLGTYLKKTASNEFTIEFLLNYGYYYSTYDDLFSTVPNVLNLTLLSPFFSFYYLIYDKYDICSIIPSTLAVSYYPPYSNTVITDVFTNNKSLIHRNLGYSIRIPTTLFFLEDVAYEEPIFNRFDYDINFSGTDGSINETIPFKTVDFTSVSIDELIFSVATRYVTYIYQETDFYNYAIPQPNQSVLPSYASIDDFLPDFYDYLEFFINCCNEKGADEMDYTAQLESIANTLVNIDSRLHATAIVEEQQTDVNITQAIIDNTESLEDTLNRPIINTNEDLSPWSAV